MHSCVRKYGIDYYMNNSIDCFAKGTNLDLSAHWRERTLNIRTRATQMAPAITRPNNTSITTNTAFMPTLLFVPSERQIVNINHEFLLTTTIDLLTQRLVK